MSNYLASFVIHRYAASGRALHLVMMHTVRVGCTCNSREAELYGTTTKFKYKKYVGGEKTASKLREARVFYYNMEKPIFEPISSGKTLVE